MKIFVKENKNKCLTLYHSTTSPIVGKFRMRGRNGWGAYFAKHKKDSKVFGDLTYKVKVCPNNTLVFHDNEVKGKGFFNMSKDVYDDYVSSGYDSLLWYRKGRFQELVVLDPNIIKDYDLMY